MPTGYTINGTDFDELFKPRVGTAGAACGYNVVTSTNPYTTQDLASRYEPSRGAVDRIPEFTRLKTSTGIDLRDLFMNGGFEIIPTYTLVANKTSINETTDRTVTFTLTTTDVPNGTILYVSLSRTDLTLSASTITVNSNTASFSATATDDAVAEGYVTFQAILRTGSQSGPEVALSNAIGLVDSSIPIPTYSIAPSLSAINEGGSVTFNVSTTNVNPGTTLYWTTSRTDLTPNNGSFIVSSGSNSFAVTANLDSTTEGYTTFTASLRAGSVTGGILTTSGTVGINDTSTTPINYSIGLRIDVYRNTSGGRNGNADNGKVRVLINRDSVLKYGSDGYCNVTVRVSNNFMDPDKDGINTGYYLLRQWNNTVFSGFIPLTSFNWNFTLRLTEQELKTKVPNTVIGRANDTGYYDITSTLPTPSTAGWSETNGIPWGSNTTITIKDTLAGTTKTGIVSSHFNGYTDQAYPNYF
jgi:hypothetical protein